MPQKNGKINYLFPHIIPLSIFGYKLKFKKVLVYVGFFKLSKFCLRFSPRNINLICPKFISTLIQRKSFRVAIILH